MQPINERYTKSWSMTFGAYILSEVKESVMVTGYHGDDQVHDRMLGEDVVPVFGQTPALFRPLSGAC